MSNDIPWSINSAKTRLAASLERIAKDGPDVKSVFTQTFLPSKKNNQHLLKTPLSGALVSVKDLFDVDGYVTRAGTRFMENDVAATSDATPIKQLRDAGVALVGHSNMTELAFSGLGINPHYGTPANSLFPDCIPGGSSAGGAVSVALGLADIAIGTDTGGSLRIPAAFNGIVGFKPSQMSVSRKGCKNLSHSLDSVGPMANSVNACRLAYHTMRQTTAVSHSLHSAKFVIPNNLALDDLDTAVSAGFSAAVDALSNAGFVIERKNIEVLDVIKTLPVWHFASVESMAEYEHAMETQLDMIDPRVASRIARAHDVDAVSYVKSLKARQALITQYEHQEAGNIILMPTCPILPPKLAALQADDELYFSTNVQVLRNPSIANVLDACSISLPFQHANHSIGIMLTAPNLHDDDLLNAAQRCEKVFRP